MIRAAKNIRCVLKVHSNKSFDVLAKSFTTKSSASNADSISDPNLTTAKPTRRRTTNQTSDAPALEDSEAKPRAPRSTRKTAKTETPDAAPTTLPNSPVNATTDPKPTRSRTKKATTESETAAPTSKPKRAPSAKKTTATATTAQSTENESKKVVESTPAAPAAPSTQQTIKQPSAPTIIPFSAIAPKSQGVVYRGAFTPGYEPADEKTSKFHRHERLLATEIDRQKRLSNKHETVSGAQKVGTCSDGYTPFFLPPDYKPVDLKPVRSQVPDPDEAPVPMLAHGLENVVHSPGVHAVKVRNQYQFAPYLERIHSPDEVAYDVLPQFVPSHLDTRLHTLAQENDCMFSSSTSSISGLLSQIFMLFSNFKRLNLSQLPTYRTELNTFTAQLRKPSAAILYPCANGTVSVRSYPGPFLSGNPVLMNLGKSMERMLTYDQQNFETLFLKKSNPKPINEKEAFHFMKNQDFLLRSQLDCYDPNISHQHKVFDLKTRAAACIRLPMFGPQCTPAFLKNQLMYLTGPSSSYEREFYDMARSAFLKYSVQARIGFMRGMFIAYHNTVKSFGFEFIPIEEMDRIVYGSTEMAERTFDVSVGVLSRLLRVVKNDFPNRTVRFVLAAAQSKRLIEVYAEPVPETPNPPQLFSDKSAFEGLESISRSTVKEVQRYVLSLETVVNGKHAYAPFDLNPLDNVKTYCSIEQDTTTPSSQILEDYLMVLRRTFLRDEQVDALQESHPQLMQEFMGTKAKN